MKKRYLKRWVEVVLTIIIVVSLLVLGGESQTHFFTSKLMAMAILLASGYILLKFGKIKE